MTLPTIGPTNCWTKAEEGIAQALSGLTSVWSFLGAADATAAKDRIWIDQLPPPADGEIYALAEWLAFFPCLLLGTPGDEVSAFQYSMVASPSSFIPNGVVELQIQDYLDATDYQDYANNERKFKNYVGDILTELQDTVFEWTWFDELKIVEYGRTSNKEEPELGPIQIALVHIPWGVRGPS